MSKTSTDSANLDQSCVNTIRFLSVDAVQKANSGHPGLPLGAAPMAYILWTKFLRHNPVNPLWIDRDRFVLSAGHGSMLLYSLLHLTGYDLPMEQIKQFRQWGSTTPGHPEREITPGVETSTGPLGQGIGNGVGMAIAEAWLSACFNRPGFGLINHYTYIIVSDGDLMEGVSYEAASLAGHLKLGKLICLYDDNRVTLSASTAISFTDDHIGRFKSHGWHCQTVDDGNDLNAIEGAIKTAQQVTDQPSFISVRTHLGYGSPNKQDTFEAHGSPLGEEEVKLTRLNLGWPAEPLFYVPDEVSRHFRMALEQGRLAEDDWQSVRTAYAEQFPQLAAELEQVMRIELPDGWNASIPGFPADPKGMATRIASGRIMNSFSAKIRGFIGGSADLNPSTFTELKDAGNFGPPDQLSGHDLQGSVGGGWSYSGRNIFFGVREHAMGTILNGLAAHGGIIPFGATFLTFSDYMRPSIRLAAIMKIHVIYVFTHDSIALGEDGPTHQSVEHIACLRAIPGLTVIRPGDANETAEAWQVAIEAKGPVALILSRQNVPTADRSGLATAKGLRQGAYILNEASVREPQISLIASGSEVGLIIAAQQKLQEQDIAVRLISMPSWELFETQSEEYKNKVFAAACPLRLVVEAGVTQGWSKYAGDRGDVLGVDRFGASAPGAVVMHEFGFSVDNVCNRALALLRNTGTDMK